MRIMGVIWKCWFLLLFCTIQAVNSQIVIPREFRVQHALSGLEWDEFIEMIMVKLGLATAEEPEAEPEAEPEPEPFAFLHPNSSLMMLIKNSSLAASLPGMEQLEDLPPLQPLPIPITSKPTTISTTTTTAATTTISITAAQKPTTNSETKIYPLRTTESHVTNYMETYSHVPSNLAKTTNNSKEITVSQSQSNTSSYSTSSSSSPTTKVVSTSSSTPKTPRSLTTPTTSTSLHTTLRTSRTQIKSRFEPARNQKQKSFHNSAKTYLHKIIPSASPQPAMAWQFSGIPHPKEPITKTVVVPHADIFAPSSERLAVETPTVRSSKMFTPGWRKNVQMEFNGFRRPQVTRNPYTNHPISQAGSSSPFGIPVSQPRQHTTTKSLIQPIAQDKNLMQLTAMLQTLAVQFPTLNIVINRLPELFSQSTTMTTTTTTPGRGELGNGELKLSKIQAPSLLKLQTQSTSLTRINTRAPPYQIKQPLRKVQDNQHRSMPHRQFGKESSRTITNVEIPLRRVWAHHGALQHSPQTKTPIVRNSLMQGRQTENRTARLTTQITPSSRTMPAHNFVNSAGKSLEMLRKKITPQGAMKPRPPEIYAAGYVRTQETGSLAPLLSQVDRLVEQKTEQVNSRYSSQGAKPIPSNTRPTHPTIWRHQAPPLSIVSQSNTHLIMTGEGGRQISEINPDHNQDSTLQQTIENSLEPMQSSVQSPDILANSELRQSIMQAPPLNLAYHGTLQHSRLTKTPIVKNSLMQDKQTETRTATLTTHITPSSPTMLAHTFMNSAGKSLEMLRQKIPPQGAMKPRPPAIYAAGYVRTQETGSPAPLPSPVDRLVEQKTEQVKSSYLSQAKPIPSNTRPTHPTIWRHQAPPLSIASQSNTHLIMTGEGGRQISGINRDHNQDSTLQQRIDNSAKSRQSSVQSPHISANSIIQAPPVNLPSRYATEKYPYYQARPPHSQSLETQLSSTPFMRSGQPEQYVGQRKYFPYSIQPLEQISDYRGPVKQRFGAPELGQVNHMNPQEQNKTSRLRKPTQLPGTRKEENEMFQPGTSGNQNFEFRNFRSDIERHLPIKITTQATTSTISHTSLLPTRPDPHPSTLTISRPHYPGTRPKATLKAEVKSPVYNGILTFHYPGLDAEQPKTINAVIEKTLYTTTPSNLKTEDIIPITQNPNVHVLQNANREPLYHWQEHSQQHYPVTRTPHLTVPQRYLGAQNEENVPQVFDTDYSSSTVSVKRPLLSQTLLSRHKVLSKANKLAGKISTESTFIGFQKGRDTLPTTKTPVSSPSTKPFQPKVKHFFVLINNRLHNISQLGVLKDVSSNTPNFNTTSTTIAANLTNTVLNTSTRRVTTVPDVIKSQVQRQFGLQLTINEINALTATKHQVNILSKTVSKEHAKTTAAQHSLSPKNHPNIDHISSTNEARNSSSQFAETASSKIGGGISIIETGEDAENVVQRAISSVLGPNKEHISATVVNVGHTQLPKPTTNELKDTASPENEQTSKQISASVVTDTTTLVQESPNAPKTSGVPKFSTVLTGSTRKATRDPSDVSNRFQDTSIFKIQVNAPPMFNFNVGPPVKSQSTNKSVNSSPTSDTNVPQRFASSKSPEFNVNEHSPESHDNTANPISHLSNRRSKVSKAYGLKAASSDPREDVRIPLAAFAAPLRQSTQPSKTIRDLPGWEWSARSSGRHSLTYKMSWILILVCQVTLYLILHD